MRKSSIFNSIPHVLTIVSFVVLILLYIKLLLNPDVKTVGQMIFWFSNMTFNGFSVVFEKLQK